MAYEKPVVVDLGSIGEHTWFNPTSSTCKGGIPPNAHIDKRCEWSGGSGDDNEACGGVVDAECQL